ncbi:MAG TPA: hypothetical protein VGO58_09380 [Chitinophagaceae bacterium]|jgi:hypothetical protein|nr:hypothetical protein [Chitinophagaceae bacterium]
MKKNMPLVLGLLVCIVLSCNNKKSNEKDDPPQNKDYLIRMDGIDSLKLEMTRAELEKVLNTKITLPNLATTRASDTISVKYRGIDMTLIMDGSDDSTATLRSIQTTHPSCKTASGIGTGADKIKAIEAYPDNRRFVGPEYEEYPVRSATKSVVAVMDTLNTRAIIFHIIDKKVVSVEVNSYYEYY